MKFCANKSELLPIVRRLCLVIGRQFESTERSCILMEADEMTNTVVFTASRSDCALQIRHLCSVEQSGTAILFGGVLQGVLEHLTDEVTSFEMDEKGLYIRNAKTAYAFTLMNATKYPKPEVGNPVQLIESKSLPEIASKVLFSVARGTDTQPQLKCVHITVHDGEFSASSCDGHRLTIAAQAAVQNEPLDILLPDSVMKTLLAVMRGIPACKIGIADGKALFLGPDMIFSAQLTQHQFMNLQTILDNMKPEAEIVVDGDLLCTELARINVGNTTGARIVLQSSRNCVKLRLVGKDDLRAETEAAAEVRRPLPKEGCCYNFSYLLEAARLVKGQTAVLQFDHTGALMVRTEHETHMLLPMRMPVEKPKRKTKKKAA